jgi:hypothetical protein
LLGSINRGARAGRDAAADHDAAEEDHDRHHGGRHEQEHELLSVQLDLVKSVI